MRMVAVASSLLIVSAIPTQAKPGPPPPNPPQIERQPDAAAYYPTAEPQLGAGGIVLVGLGVRLDGKVTRCAIERASRSAALDEAACALARELRFVPDPRAASEPQVEYGCCTRVEISWGDGTAKLRPLHGRGAYHPNLNSLFWEIDYPAAARRAREQGRVVFAVDIDVNGGVTDCTIVESSGSAVLDGKTCEIIRRRLIMAPARDEDGKAVPERLVQRIVWRL